MSDDDRDLDIDSDEEGFGGSGGGGGGQDKRAHHNALVMSSILRYLANIWYLLSNSHTSNNLKKTNCRREREGTTSRTASRG